MDKLKWCLKAKKGLERIEPSENLAKIYFLKAEEALDACAALNGRKEWEIASAYYAMYLGVYAILQKFGVKCENHTCTITFMRKFLQFTPEECDFLEASLIARVDSQYYIDRTVPDKQYLAMLKDAPRFLARCKSIASKITEKDIINIREQLKSLQRS
jgi:uncharacterized protein (UPF0332 family)